MGNIHINDVGTIFKVTITDDGVALDVSTASAKQIKFRKPSGVTVSKTADFDTDGSDGVIKYAATSGFIDEIGTWRIQGRIVNASGEWSSQIKPFTINKNI